MTFARAAILLARLERTPTARLRRILRITVVLVMLGMISHGNYAGSGDAVHYLVAAHSIAFDRDLDLSNDYGDPSDIISAKPGAHARLDRNGVLRPVHDVGLPLLAAPFIGAAYAIAERTDALPETIRRRAKIDGFIALRQLVAFVMILLTGQLAVALFDASSNLTGRQAFAFLWALIWALSPPILSHGYVFLTEVPTALLAMLAYGRTRTDGSNESFGRGIVLGGVLGLLVLVHIRNLGLVAGFVLLLAWRRPAVSFATGAAVAFGAMMALKVGLNLHFWGSAITTPLAQPGVWTGFAATARETVLRAFGMLFDARHGLLLWAPIYLLAPAAWLVLRRRSAGDANGLLLLFVCYLVPILLPMTNIQGWRGGWSPAARFLVPIAPLLALPVPLLFRRAAGWPIVIVILGVQLWLDGLFWGYPMMQWSEGPGAGPFVELLFGPRVADSLPRWQTLSGGAVSIALGATSIWTLLTLLLARRATATTRIAV